MAYMPSAATPSSYKPETSAKSESSVIPVQYLATSPANDAPKKPVQESNVETKETPKVSIDECWQYLRRERDRLLGATDYVNTGVVPLSLDERAQLYAYRRKLRELPEQGGAPWTPKTIPWPIRPQTR